MNPRYLLPNMNPIPALSTVYIKLRDKVDTDRKRTWVQKPLQNGRNVKWNK